ncbi:MAG TPA: hypothetical protein VGH53_27905 [Streptosporangiaceae bacterium]
MTDPSRRSSCRRTVAAACAAAGLTVVLAGFGFTTTNGLPPGNHPVPSTSAPATLLSGMPGMSTTDGLAAGHNGYQMASGIATLPAGKITDYRFTITGPDGRPVTDFAVEQTRRLHFYAIRSDLTGYQHLHPTLASDGTWTATMPALQPGTWRLYASFVPNTGPGKGREFVLSRTITVSGRAVATAVPAPSPSTTIDGYTVTVNGQLTANRASALTVTITKDDAPVTNLQPYLDTYAHLTAFHEADLAFAHLHPATMVGGDHGGPTLPFHAELSRSGNWRLFLQFRTSGTVHAAAITVHVSPRQYERAGNGSA